MAKRAEEKQQRRREREAAERAAAAKASRDRTLRIGGAAVLVLAAIAVIAFFTFTGGGDDAAADSSQVAAAARTAGCSFKQYPAEGRTHVTGKATYKTNPPTSGNHNVTPAPDGIYPAASTPEKENFVHSLEHGRIEFQYRAGASAADVAKLRGVAEEELNGSAGYHVLMFQNSTDMPERFAATAWTKSIACPALTSQALDALRTFRRAYTDKAPELVP